MHIGFVLCNYSPAKQYLSHCNFLVVHTGQFFHYNNQSLTLWLNVNKGQNQQVLQEHIPRARASCCTTSKYRLYLQKSILKPSYTLIQVVVKENHSQHWHAVMITTLPELQLSHRQQVPHSKGSYHTVSGSTTGLDWRQDQDSTSKQASYTVRVYWVEDIYWIKIGR